MNKSIKILDCTLRDGGLGLEDANRHKISSESFSSEVQEIIIKKLNRTNLDIIEIGSIELSEDDKTRFAIYQNVRSVSARIPAYRNPNSMYVGLFRGPDTPVEDIPEWEPSLVDGLRVIIRYSELDKSLDFCAALAQKGYKVFVQPMLTMRYTKEEIEHILRRSNEMKAYAVYFVDSYGYMQAEDVQHFLYFYDERLDPEIKIGFHAHNNMNLAYANVLSFIGSDIQRDLICDSCIIGMGQGAGNLQTELIAPYLRDHYQNEYDYRSILDLCDLIEPYMAESIWGYSVTRLLPALHKTAYKYAISLRKRYKLSFSVIDEVLSMMPEDLRHRYTPENTEKLLKIAGIR